MARRKFGFRKFNGKQYRFSTDASTKSEARRLAGFRRESGRMARVTKEKDIHGRTYYIVWVS